MNACPWEKISDFRSYSEFEQFVAWMDEQVRSAAAVERPVERPYIGATTLREKWFQHTSTGTTWRLVWPDAQFSGIVEPVEASLRPLVQSKRQERIRRARGKLEWTGDLDAMRRD